MPSTLSRASISASTASSLTSESRSMRRCSTSSRIRARRPLDTGLLRGLLLTLGLLFEDLSRSDLSIGFQRLVQTFSGNSESRISTQCLRNNGRQLVKSFVGGHRVRGVDLVQHGSGQNSTACSRHSIQLVSCWVIGLQLKNLRGAH